MSVCDILVVVAIWWWSVWGILVKNYSEQGQGACIRKNTGAAAPLAVRHITSTWVLGEHNSEHLPIAA